MSKAEEEKISLILGWSWKIMICVLSFVLSFIFVEMRNDTRQLTSDVSSIKERIAKIEGMMNR